MSELSFMGKLMQAMELSKMGHVGMELTYFDVIELLGEIESLKGYIAELEAENNRLAELLLNELSQVEIATDLGNKRWTALQKISEDGEKHNTNWCKRIAQEGLGIKNA